MIDFRFIRPATIQTEEAIYCPAYIVFSDEALSNLKDKDHTLKLYGGISNYMRSYILELRNRSIGNDALVVLVLNGNTCGCEKPTMSILRTLDALINDRSSLEGDDNISWIKNNKEEVKEIVSMVNMEGIDLVHVDSDDSYALYFGKQLDNSKIPSALFHANRLSKAGEQPLSRLASLTNSPYEIMKPSNKQVDLPYLLTKNFFDQNIAANDVSDEIPDAIKTDIHRELDNKGTNSDLLETQKIIHNFNVNSKERNKYKRRG